MARARLKMTGASTKRAQPTCKKCGKTIEPGQYRYEWSFRYGGTHTQHQSCGAPRPSETTQGNVSILYAAQEAVEDTVNQRTVETKEDFDNWKSDVESALDQAASDARDLAAEYTTAAESFGGSGPNQERADACEAWADELDDASSNVSLVDMEEIERSSFEEGDDGDDEFETALSDARDAAVDEVESAATDAIYNLEL